MTGGEVAQLITSIATLIGVLGGLVVSLRNSRKIEQVHLATNSKMDTLLELTAASSKAEGVLEGKATPITPKETVK